MNTNPQISENINKELYQINSQLSNSPRFKELYQYLKISPKESGDKRLSRTRKLFIPFVVLGDPNFEISKQIIDVLIQFADIIEFGIPFSDPVADGPTIQKADIRAAKSGINRDNALNLIKYARSKTQKPIALLTYANILGVGKNLETNIRRFAEAGVDAIIVADVPMEESQPYIQIMKKNNMDFVFLVAPTTEENRLVKILELARGYIYYVSILGTTGARDKIAEYVRENIKMIKMKLNDLNNRLNNPDNPNNQYSNQIPLCVGFGISNPEQAKEIISYGADGVIIGSAIVKRIEKYFDKPAYISSSNKPDDASINDRTNKMLEEIKNFCQGIRSAIDNMGNYNIGNN
ncbi:MAG: tryptophan synthase subunit alpha [Promethearchaeota archaeon]